MAKFKVLNVEGETIIVNEINPDIHRHRSGRAFTENDKCVKKVEAKPEEVIVPEEILKEVETTPEVLDRVAAVSAYKEKYGRRPSSQMKTENIIAKLK